MYVLQKPDGILFVTPFAFLMVIFSCLSISLSFYFKEKSIATLSLTPCMQFSSDFQLL